ncbi:MAG: MBL fold metallo-hydrolase [Anaerolineales bacterium]
MKLTVWGARGSLPTPLTSSLYQERLREVLKRARDTNLHDPIAIDRFIERLPDHLATIVGGETTCYELQDGARRFILDMGSGVRRLGLHMLQDGFADGNGTAHIFFSHTHYDHVEGFPFFAPQFVPGNHFIFHSPYPDLEDRLRALMHHPFFPVDFDYPLATREFHLLEAGRIYDIDSAQVEIMPQNHPGGSYAYSITLGGKKIVYGGDAEYPNMEPEATKDYEHFIANAEVLIFDTMYTYEDVVTNKVDWGHSNARIGAELAWRAGVKRLLLSHHDPIASDHELWAKINDADQHLRYRANRAGADALPVQVSLAYEALTLEL